ncbi:rhodanese-like domain-containing protein [Erythrobacter sp. THAF29]|uniref:rhodanese-like domain-containing protein n=1 Tax=Erythrobacter sp. THAF29 TaxID=2587851 RepID=UPI00126813C0|nr:rhodanese-like domain-containing protein [Erythrobacter sp. THAF29]QFT78939.1 molybdopterin biosynthesis protein MoeB [Erythrobacter sp. THAF29]
MRITAILLVVPALALSACAPTDEGERNSSPLPLGYELASAKTAVSIEGDQALVIDLTVDELMDHLAQGNVRLIDVRTAEEVAEGRIPGAEHIALADFDPAKLDLSDGREVIVYCRSGRRSGIAGKRLAQHTGKPAKHLAGGIKAWREAGGSID